MHWITSWWSTPTREQTLDDFEVLDHRLDETLANTLQQKEGFNTCLANAFPSLELLAEREKGTFSTVYIVSHKDQTDQTETFALKIYNSPVGDQKGLLQPGHQGEFWRPFFTNDPTGPVYAIAWDGKRFCLKNRFELQQCDGCLTLYATFSPYHDQNPSLVESSLTQESKQVMGWYEPKHKAESFYYTVGSRFRGLKLHNILGQGSLSKVWRATYQDADGMHEMAFRMSRTDYLPQSDTKEKYFQISENRFGGEWMAFVSDDPHILEARFAIAWSAKDNCYIVLDYTEIRAIHENRSLLNGNTLTLYATLSPYYANSETLEDYISQNGPCSEDTLRSFATQLLLGLQHLPTGLIHRDLKPANILVIDKKLLKILDFGFSAASSEMNESMVGTPLFMAPEYFSDAEHTHKVDIFSTFGVLFKLLTGKHFIEVTSLNELIHAMKQYCDAKTGPENDPRLQGYSEKLRTFLSRMGHPDPNKRWSAEQLLNEDCFLRTPVQHSEKKEAPTVSIPTPKPTQASPKNPGSWVFHWMVLAGVALITYHLARYFFGHSKERPLNPSNSEIRFF